MHRAEGSRPRRQRQALKKKTRLAGGVLRQQPCSKQARQRRSRRCFFLLCWGLCFPSFFSLCGKVVNACLLGCPKSFVVQFYSFLRVWGTRSFSHPPRPQYPIPSLECELKGRGHHFKTTEGLESRGQTVMLMTSVSFPQKDIAETLSTIPVVSKGNSRMWAMTAKDVQQDQLCSLGLWHQTFLCLCWGTSTWICLFSWLIRQVGIYTLLFLKRCIVDKYLGYLWRPFFWKFAPAKCFKICWWAGDV